MDFNEMAETLEDESKRRLEFQSRYQVTITPDEYRNLSAFFDAPGNDEGARYDVGSAMNLSKIYAVSVPEAYRNLDAYREGLYADNVKYRDKKNFFKATADLYKVGTNGQKYSDLGGQLRMAHLAGDKDAADRLWKEIDAIEAENLALQDNIPSEGIVNKLRNAAVPSMPFTFTAAAVGLAGGTVAPGVGLAAGFLYSAKQMADASYIDLIKAGVNNDLANGLSMGVGAVSGAVETLLGNVPALNKALSGVFGLASKGLADKIGGEIGKRLLVNGVMKKAASLASTVSAKAAGKIAVEALKDMGGEITEEVLQYFVDEASLALADILQDGKVDTHTAEEFLAGFGATVKTAALATMVLSSGNVLLNTAATVHDARAVKKDAQTIHDEDAFIAKHKDDEIFKEGATEEEKRKTLSDIYSAHEPFRSAEAAALEETIYAGEDREATQFKDANGTIVEVEEEIDGTAFEAIPKERINFHDLRFTDTLNETGGEVSGIFKAKKADGGVVGAVKYVNDDGEIRVTAVQMNEGRAADAGLIFDAFVETHEGATWEPKTERGKKLREAIGEVRSPETRTIERIAVEQFHFPQTHARTASEAVKLFASLQGKTLADLLGETGFRQSSVSELNRMAQTKSAQVRDGDKIGAILKAHEGHIKKWIYTTERSTPETLFHELGHDTFWALEGDAKAKVYAALGITGEATDEQQEQFTEALTQYLAEGKTPHEGLRNIFEAIRDVLRAVYDAVKNEGRLTAEMREALDAVFERAQVSSKTAAQTSVEGRGLTQNTKTDMDVSDEKMEAHSGFTVEDGGGADPDSGSGDHRPVQGAQTGNRPGLSPDERREVRETAQTSGAHGETEGAQKTEEVSSEEIKTIAAVLETGESTTVENEEIGTITVDAGKTGKSGYGLKHIIEQRFVKDKMKEDDIAALLPLVVEAAKNGVNNPERVRGEAKYALEKNGIIAIVSKDWKGKDERFVISGYAMDEKETEATDTIQAVSVSYGYAPEFSGLRKQVGAVIASVDPDYHTAAKMSSPFAGELELLAKQEKGNGQEDENSEKSKEGNYQGNYQGNRVGSIETDKNIDNGGREYKGRYRRVAKSVGTAALFQSAERIASLEEIIGDSELGVSVRARAVLEAASLRMGEAALKEAIRQGQAVWEAYHNSDGSAKPGYLKAPNGKESLLAKLDDGGRAWCLVRTENFKRWFGEWEGATLIEMAEKVWNGGTTPARINFTPSEKLKAEIQKLTGQDLQEVFVTDSDVRHIKKHHGEKQAQQGQVDITPEDMALIPFVMNEFDTVVVDSVDKLGNKKLLFTKQINGTAYTASIERGANKEQVITFWKTQSRLPRANALGSTSGTTPTQETIQHADDLRNSKNNVSKVRDENGEPLVVYHGTGAEFDIFENESGLPAYYFTAEERRAKIYAKMKGDDKGIVKAVFLNLKHPEFVTADEITTDNIETYTDGEHDGAIDKINRIYAVFSPTQIKDVENLGTVSQEQEILFQSIGETGAAALDAAEEAEARRQYDEVRETYTDAQLRTAPNGKPITHLNDDQLVLIRTPFFKRYFGDWETLERIKAILGIKPKKYTAEQGINKKTAEDIVRDFGVVTNILGDKTSIPVGVVGKMKEHGGFETLSIIRNLKELYQSAKFAYSEKEREQTNHSDGTPHKKHDNFIGYDNFVNKFEVDGTPYFIRFTVQEEKPSKKQPDMPHHTLHSSSISEVSIYNTTGELVSSSGNNPAEAPLYVDKRLANFFNSVKPSDVSKAVDENGVPLVVYHGTKEDFDIFSTEKQRYGDLGKGFYFTQEKEYAEDYGERMISAFLSIKNPFTVKDDIINSDGTVTFQGSPYEQIEAALPETAGMTNREKTDYLKSKGFDGIIRFPMMTVFSPSQIKSATDNVGTFDPGKNSILFQSEGFSDAEHVPTDLEDLVVFAGQYETHEEFKEYLRGEFAEYTDADAAWAEGFWEEARKKARSDELTDPLMEGKKLSVAEANAFVLRELTDRAKLREFVEWWGKAKKGQGGRERLADLGLKYTQEEDEFDSGVNWHWNNTLYGNIWHGAMLRAASGYDYGKSAEKTERMEKAMMGSVRHSPDQYREAYAFMTGRSDLIDVEGKTLKDEVREKAKGTAYEGEVEWATGAELKRIVQRLHSDEIRELVTSGKLTEADPRIKEYVSEETKNLEKQTRAIPRIDRDIQVEELRLERQYQQEAAQYKQAFALQDNIVSAMKVEAGLREEAGGWKNLVDYTKVDAERASRAAKKLRKEIKKTKALREEYNDFLRRAEMSEARIGEMKRLLDAKQGKMEAEKAAAAAAEQLEAMKQLQEVRRKLLGKGAKGMLRTVKFGSGDGAVEVNRGEALLAAQHLIRVAALNDMDSWLGKTYNHGESLLETAAQFKTSKEYRDQLRMEIGATRYKTVEGLLEKGLDELTKAERKKLYLALPQDTALEDMGFFMKSQEAREAESLVQFDIEETYSADGWIHLVLGEKSQGLVNSVLPSHLQDRLANLPLSEWTLEELIDLAETMDNKYTEAKETLVRQKADDRERWALMRALLVKSLEERLTKAQLHKHFHGAPGSAGEVEGALKDNKKSPFGPYSLMEIHRFARMLDGGIENGKFKEILVWAESRSFEVEFRKREKAHREITGALEKLGIKPWELEQVVFEKKDFMVSGDRAKFTLDNVLYLLGAEENSANLRALIYGNLTTQEERDFMKAASTGDAELLLMANPKGVERYQEIKKAAAAFLDKAENQKYKKLLDFVMDYYDRNIGDLDLINRAVFNKPVFKEKGYLPMVRKALNGSDVPGAANQLLSAAGYSHANVDKGNTVKRINVADAYQQGVEMDLYKGWLKSVDRSAHLVGYSAYIKDMKNVFKGPESVALRNKIENAYGKGAVRYLDRFTDTTANPDALKGADDFGKAIRVFQGLRAQSYLFFRTSALVSQAVTSPWSFTAYVSMPEYFKNVISFIGNSAQWDAVRSRSAFMASESFDPAVELVKEMKAKAKGKVSAALTKAQAGAASVFSAVNDVFIYAGWKSVYDAEVKKLEAHKDISEEEVEVQAVRKADEVTAKAQQTRKYLSPLYKYKDTALSAMLAFTSPQAVIFQQWFYDIPQAFRNKDAKFIARSIAGLAIMGVLYNLVREGLPEEEDKKAATWVFWGLSQFADSLPLVGQYGAKALEAALTGKAAYGSASPMSFPVVDKMYSGIQNLSKEQWAKAARDFAESGALSAGVPTSGAKELAAFLGVDPWKGDFEVDIFPQALLGQRK